MSIMLARTFRLSYIPKNIQGRHFTVLVVGIKKQSKLFS